MLRTNLKLGSLALAVASILLLQTPVSANQVLDLSAPGNEALRGAAQVEKVITKLRSGNKAVIRLYNRNLLITYVASNGSDATYLVPADLSKLLSADFRWKKGQGFGGYYVNLQAERQTAIDDNGSLVEIEIRLTDSSGVPLDELLVNEP